MDSKVVAIYFRKEQKYFFPHIGSPAISSETISPYRFISPQDIPAKVTGFLNGLPEGYGFILYWKKYHRPR